MSRIPTHVTNYNFFKDGRRLIGTADATLPNLTNLTDSLRGAAIFGEIDMPVQCHFAAGSVVINWHTVTDDMLLATVQEGVNLDAWAAHQYHDSGTNGIDHWGWRYVMNTAPKTLNLGNLGVGVKGASATEYELIGIRALFNDQIMLEIHKTNAICRWWNGNTLVDVGQRIRQLTGMN